MADHDLAQDVTTAFMADPQEQDHERRREDASAWLRVRAAPAAIALPLLLKYVRSENSQREAIEMISGLAGDPYRGESDREQVRQALRGIATERATSALNSIECVDRLLRAVPELEFEEDDCADLASVAMGDVLGPHVRRLLLADSRDVEQLERIGTFLEEELQAGGDCAGYVTMGFCYDFAYLLSPDEFKLLNEARCHLGPETGTWIEHFATRNEWDAEPLARHEGFASQEVPKPDS